jgi:hypothetical protein
MTDLVQILAELSNEGIPGAAPGQEPAIGRPRVEEAEETQALDDGHHQRIHWDHTFRFEFAQWHVDRPLIGAGRAEAVEG